MLSRYDNYTWPHEVIIWIAVWACTSLSSQRQAGLQLCVHGRRARRPSLAPQQASRPWTILLWGQCVAQQEARGQHVATQIICSTSVRKPQHSTEETFTRTFYLTSAGQDSCQSWDLNITSEFTSGCSLEDHVKRQVGCDQGGRL